MDEDFTVKVVEFPRYTVTHMYLHREKQTYFDAICGKDDRSYYRCNSHRIAVQMLLALRKYSVIRRETIWNCEYLNYNLVRHFSTSQQHYLNHVALVYSKGKSKLEEGSGRQGVGEMWKWRK